MVNQVKSSFINVLKIFKLDTWITILLAVIGIVVAVWAYLDSQSPHFQVTNYVLERQIGTECTLPFKIENLKGSKGTITDFYATLDVANDSIDLIRTGGPGVEGEGNLLGKRATGIITLFSYSYSPEEIFPEIEGFQQFPIVIDSHEIKEISATAHVAIDINPDDIAVDTSYIFGGESSLSGNYIPAFYTLYFQSMDRKIIKSEPFYCFSIMTE